MKNIFILVLLSFCVNVLIAQAKIPTENTKIRQTDRVGVLYINSKADKKDGNVQMINQFTDNPTAMWKFILISPGIYKIQNIGTSEYLGVNKTAKVPMASSNNNPPGYLEMYFLFASNDDNTDVFKWKVKFYRQRKPGMATTVVDKGKPKANEPYESKYATDDEYDIINVATKSRLNTINVNGLMRGDEISRACLDTDDRDEFDGTVTKGSNGQAVIKNSDNYVARNNQSRWQFIGLPKANTNAVVNNKANQPDVKQPKPIAAANNNNQQNNNTAPTTQQQVPLNTNIETNGLENKTYVLQSVDMYSIKNEKRKKLPSFLNALTKRKIELSFLNSNQALVKNVITNQTTSYNWQIKENNILHLLPQNKNSDDASYVGEIKFEGNKMIHIVKEGKTETEYVYEKK
jgi:hypothetical protein